MDKKTDDQLDGWADLIIDRFIKFKGVISKKESSKRKSK